jgi:hypothetical protein
VASHERSQSDNADPEVAAHGWTRESTPLWTRCSAAINTLAVTRRGLRFFGALVLCGLGGCRAHFQQKVAIDASLKVSAVAVYPFGFRWPQGAYRSFELSQRLIDVVLKRAGDQVLVFGPSEFKVYRPLDDHAWAASNVVGLFPQYGLSAHKAVVLRPWAERRQATSQRELYDSQGKPKGISTVQEITYIGHVEIIHPSTAAVLVEESGLAQVDSFADHADDADPAPELTQLMCALTADAVDALSDQLAAPAPPVDFDVKYERVPGEVFSYAEEGKPELEKELGKLEPVEADVVRMARVRFANPKISDDEAGRLLKLPGGLYVTAAGSDFKAQPGDLIHLIDGRPALPQSLNRVRFVKGPVQVRIRRPTGISQETTLP